MFIHSFIHLLIAQGLGTILIMGMSRSQALTILEVLCLPLKILAEQRTECKKEDLGQNMRTECKKRTCLISHPIEGSLGLPCVSLSTIFFSNSHTTWIMSNISTAHSPSVIVPSVQPLSNHSLSVSSWSILVKGKHNSHRGVYLLWLPLQVLCCIPCLKKTFGQSRQLKNSSNVLQKDPPVLGVCMEEWCSHEGLSLL